MIDELMNFKHSEINRHPNPLLIPVTNLDITKSSAHFFNRLLEYLEHEEINKLVRTPSGSISFAAHKLRLPAYDVHANRTCVEITLLIKEGMWRIQFRTNYNKDNNNNSKVLYGKQAFSIFKKLCTKFNIEMDDYIITNGAEVKKEIPKYLKCFERPSYADRIFNHVNHIDFHSSFAGGLVNAYPEFKEVVDYCFDHRHQNETYKSVLNCTIGYMQSPICKAKWAHLAKAAITDNNERVQRLARRLRESDRLPITYNTDGIWYQGEIYHGQGEGERPGEWHNDHFDCKFRARGPSSYQYIEDGKCNTVQSGATKLDSVKPREFWEWGDIYNSDCREIVYVWKNNRIYYDGEVI